MEEAEVELVEAEEAPAAAVEEEEVLVEPLGREEGVGEAEEMELELKMEEVEESAEEVVVEEMKYLGPWIRQFQVCNYERYSF